MLAVADCAVRKVTHPEVNALGSFIVKDWIWEIGNVSLDFLDETIRFPSATMRDVLFVQGRTASYVSINLNLLTSSILHFFQ